MAEKRKERSPKVHKKSARNRRRNFGNCLFRTLNAQMIYTFVIALVLGIVLAVATDAVGTQFIDKFYMTDKVVEERREALLDSLSKYISDKNIASSDASALDQWCADNGGADISIYREDDFALRHLKDYYGTRDSAAANKAASAKSSKETEADTAGTTDASAPKVGSSGSTSSGGTSSGTTLPASDSSPDTEKTASPKDNTVYSAFDKTVYPIEFSDGTFSVSVTDVSEYRYSDGLLIADVLVFALTLLLVMLVYNHRMIRRIGRLSQQIGEVSRGAFDQSVGVKGKDELSQLANDVENMRMSLVERILGEKKAWHANQELITSISHDIRNPLTTLIGYSDILANGQYENQEQFERYILNCRDKAYQLKDLTDELFGYFLVFGKPSVNVNCEIDNAQILLMQLLGEPLADLRSRGYIVNSVMLSENYFISVDVMMLKRVFDNIFSNILKYADPEKPLTVMAAPEKTNIYIKFVNQVRKCDNPIESTKIGIKTCERLCTALNVDFKYHIDGSEFITELSIPVIPMPKEELHEEHS